MRLLNETFKDDLLYVFHHEQCQNMEENFLVIVRKGAEITPIPGCKIMHYDEDFESFLTFKLHGKSRKMMTMLSLEQCHALLDRITWGVLSFDIDGLPYSVGMNHVRIGKRIFFHCGPKGYKLAGIGQKATYFVNEDFGPALNVGTHSFNSVSCLGTLKAVENLELKKEVLLSMVEKLAPIHPWNEDMPKRTTVLELELDFMQGKGHVY